jgi:hypothetical protein
MKNFFGFDPSNPYITPKRVVHAIVANGLVVLWAAVVVYLAFTDPFNAWVCFISFMFSYLINK